MSEETEREARQRALAVQALMQYRSGTSTLRRLIQGLEALALELKLVPEEWLADFQGWVIGLDALYAVALDRGVADNLPLEYQVDVDEAVARLEELLAQLPPLPEES